MSYSGGANEKIFSELSAHTTFSVLLQRKKVICFILTFYWLVLALMWL